MDTTTAAVTTGVVVAAGRWSQEKKVDAKIFVGTGIVAIFLAVIASNNEKLASQFAVLILVSAVLMYGVDIGKKIGKATSK